MASRKTEVERIIDTVLTAAGLPETETARLLEEHWEACCNRVDRSGSPHRPEWREKTNGFRDAFAKGAAGLDPADPTVQATFDRLLEVCEHPPPASVWS
jgi:hypothetical protein